MKNRQFRLRQRPTGRAKSTDFELVEASVPAPGFGEALVKPRSQSSQH
jgi:NADPH-dependent curcumin reductase CurA